MPEPPPLCSQASREVHSGIKVAVAVGYHSRSSGSLWGDPKPTGHLDATQRVDIKKTFWHINPHPIHKIVSEEFETCGTLSVTIAMTDFRSSPAPS